MKARWTTAITPWKPRRPHRRVLRHPAGKVPHSDHLALHAGAIADLSAVVGTLFEVNAPGGHALPAIWENPEDFATKVADFQTAAQGLRDAIANGDAVARPPRHSGGPARAATTATARSNSAARHIGGHISV